MRRLVVLVLWSWATLAVRAGEAPFSVGLVSGLAVPIVTSDVVGPDAPEGSHERRTVHVGISAGVQGAWEFLQADDVVLSLHGRMLGLVANTVEHVVHAHEDVVVVGGQPVDTVFTNHGVRHHVQRVDGQILLGLTLRSVPLRFVAGMAFGMSVKDAIDETFRDDRGRTGEGQYAVLDRTGLVVGVELPMRTDWLSISPYLSVDLDLASTAETAIPYSSHVVSVGLVSAVHF